MSKPYGKPAVLVAYRPSFPGLWGRLSTDELFRILREDRQFTRFFEHQSRSIQELLRLRHGKPRGPVGATAGRREG